MNNTDITENRIRGILALIFGVIGLLIINYLYSINLYEFLFWLGGFIMLLIVFIYDDFIKIRRE
jgi:high-affinity Fe2+/Pb2+ permease